jgi:hypothetical protein
MSRNLRRHAVCTLALGLLGLAPLALLKAQEGTKAAAGSEVKITVSTAAAPPPVSITLYERHGHVTPCKGKCAHTGGGLIDVATPSPDTVTITMTGAVLSNSDMTFDLEQCFEVSFDDPKVKKAKMTLEGRVIGLLRGEKKGCADYSDACAHVSCGPAHLISVCVPPHSACDCESLAVNDHDGPKWVPVAPGKFTLLQTFHIGAHSTCCLCKRPSAEFAPDPALDPLWISYWDPFHGCKKDSFGFQVVLKVAQDEDKDGNGKAKENNGVEKLPPPKP